jgi:hypothetical protein
VWLYYWRSGGFRSEWMLTRSGLTFGVAGAMAVVAALIGYLVIGRSAARLGALAAQVSSAEAAGSAAAAAEIGRLQRRMGVAAIVATALIVIVTAMMAVGRYV